MTDPVAPELTGQPAPDFTARTQHGELLSLSGMRGTPVVLVFYPWAFSGICTGELQALRDDHARYTELGARVVAVSCDAMFTLRAFADAEGLAFDLVTDHWPHGAIARAYGIFDDQAGCAVRGSYLIDAEGTVTWQVVHQIGQGRVMVDALTALRT